MSGEKTDSGLVIPIIGDATGFVNETRRAGEAAKQFGQTASQAGQTGAAGMEASQRTVNSIAAQIRREIVNIESSTKGAMAGIEKSMDLRGLSQTQKDSLKPLLEQLALARAEQDRYTASMGNAAMSAKQMQAAMRGLPAQFTDIWVSLATGQMPMMVLMQQGGQIKDMFGGIVPALKAVGTALWAMVNPFTVAAAAIGVLALAYKQGADEAQLLNKALIETGNSAGLTIDNLRGMAKRMSDVGMTQGKAVEALEEFIRAGAAGSQELERFTTAAVNLERAGGQSVEKTAKAFADLAKEPYDATVKLTEGMNYLYTAELEQIRALEQIGLKTEAAKVAQAAYARGIEEQTPKLVENLGYVERAWKGISGAAKDAWDWIKNIGRQDSELQKVSQQIAELSARREAFASRGRDTAALDKEIALLREQQYNLQENVRLQGRMAAMDQQRAERNKALAEWYETEKGKLDDKLKMEREINEAIILGVKAGKTSLEIVERINEIRENYNKKKGKEADPFSGDRDWMKDLAQTMEQSAAAMTKAEAETAKLTKSQELLLKIITDPRWASTNKDIKQWFLQFVYGKIAVEQAEQVLQDLNKEQEKSAKLNAKAYDAYAKETAAISQKADKMKIEADAVLGVAGAKQELTAATLRQSAADLEAWATSQLVYGADEAHLVLVRERIAEMRRLADETERLGEGKNAKELEKSWDKLVDQVENSLTDALMRGFENGKGFLENLIDTIKNGFKTLVVKLLIEPVMKSAVGGTLGALGLGPSGAAAAVSGGGAGGLSLLGSVGSLFGGTGSFLSGLTSLATPAAAFNQFLLGGSAMQLLGAATPYIAAAYAAYRIISGKGTGRDRSPALQNYSMLGPLDIGYANVSPNLTSSAAYDQILKTIVAGVAQSARSLGGSANATTSYGLFSSVSPDGKGGQVVANVLGQSGWRYNYNVNGANDTVGDRIEEQLPRMILAGLIDSDIDQRFKDYFNAIDIETATEDQVTAAIAAASAVNEFTEAMDSLDKQLSVFSGMSIEEVIDFGALFGGLDKAGQSIGYFVDTFYSAEEKMKLLGDSVSSTFAEMGLSWIDSREEYVQFARSLDLNDPAQAQLYARLIAIGPAVNALWPALDDATDSTEDLTAATRSAVDIQREREGLERRWLEITGDTAALRELDLAGLDESNKALQLKIWAYEDEQKAIEDTERTLRELAERQATVQEFFDTLNELGAKFPGLTSMSLEAAEAFGELFGSLNAAAGSIQFFRDNFLTVEQTTADTLSYVRTTLDDLGYEWVDTTEEFSALVQGMLDSGDAVSEVLAKLLLLAPSVVTAWGALPGSSANPRAGGAAGAAPYNPGAYIGNGVYWNGPMWSGGEERDPMGHLTPEQQSQWWEWFRSGGVGPAPTFGEAGGEMAVDQALLDQINEGRRLEVELLRLTVGEAAALAKQREYDIVGMSAEAIATYDANEALRQRIADLTEAARAEEAAAAVTKSLAETRFSLEINLLRAQGEEEQALALIREKEIDGLTEAQVAMYDYNVALQQQIIGANEAAAAAREAAAAAQQERAATAALNDATSGLEIGLLRAQGEEAQALALIRERETAGMTEAQIAIYDYNVALRSQIAELTAAGEAAQKLASQTQSLQMRYLELTGNVDAIREIELANLDESNRALQQRIWALEDEAAALAKANQLSSQREQMERRILELEGKTDEIRARELADLDPSLRALQETIWALEAANLAAAEAAREEEEAARNAMRAQEEELSRIRDAQEEIARSLREFFDLLQGYINDLLGEAGAVMSAAQGRSFISSALAAAKATGSLPDINDLDRAIAAVKKDLDKNNFATKVQADRARIELANQLIALQGFVSGQNNYLAGLNGNIGTLTQASIDSQTELHGSSPSVIAANAQAGIGRLEIVMTEARDELRDMRRETQATAVHTSKTLRILERVNRDGESLLVTNA